jgi:ankyrin repeat protein
MAASTLPARPNLEYLKKLAKEHLRELRKVNLSAKLAAAQLAVAREHGFSSWRALKAHIESNRTGKISALVPGPKKVTKADWKPIMDAAFAGDAQRVEKLLKAGADPNVVSGTNHRYRPLHRAIEHKKTMPKHTGHDEVVKILLQNGADPKQRGSISNVSALYLAATSETRFVPLLRKHFEPFDIHHAALLLVGKRVRELVAKDPALATSRDERGFAPLHYCAASALFLQGKTWSDSQIQIAKYLLDAGANASETYLYDGKWPISVLYHASGAHDNPALTRLLLEAGADPCDGESVYHASDEGHERCLALFEKHVEPTKLARECSMCLTNQLHWGKSRALPWLLAHGADPNFISTHYGDAALHGAVRNGANEKVIAQLLKHGADPNLKNREGKTAMQLAKASGTARIVKQISQA